MADPAGRHCQGYCPRILRRSLKLAVQMVLAVLPFTLPSQRGGAVPNTQRNETAEFVVLRYTQVCNENIYFRATSSPKFRELHTDAH